VADPDQAFGEAVK